MKNNGRDRGYGMSVFLTKPGYGMSVFLTKLWQLFFFAKTNYGNC